MLAAGPLTCRPEVGAVRHSRGSAVTCDDESRFRQNWEHSVARTEFGVAIGSVLIVAGVLAIPILAPTAAVAPLVIPHVLPKPSQTSTASPTGDLVGSGCTAYSAQVPTG